MSNFCKCAGCGRILKNEKSIILGYGITCYKKIQKSNKYGKLFEYNIDNNISNYDSITNKKEYKKYGENS